MTTPTAITILGLGPGRYDDLTLQAHALLEQAARDRQTVYFRTLIHPTVEPIRQAIPNLRIESFDPLYDESADWSSLYQQIAEKVCSLAAQQPVIYAVTGHPLVGEAFTDDIVAEELVPVLQADRDAVAVDLFESLNALFSQRFDPCLHPEGQFDLPVHLDELVELRIAHGKKRFRVEVDVVDLVFADVLLDFILCFRP